MHQHSIRSQVFMLFFCDGFELPIKWVVFFRRENNIILRFTYQCRMKPNSWSLLLLSSRCYNYAYEEKVWNLWVLVLKEFCRKCWFPLFRIVLSWIYLVAVRRKKSRLIKNETAMVLSYRSKLKIDYSEREKHFFFVLVLLSNAVVSVGIYCA